MALQRRVDQDIEAISQLRRERDELLHTIERLRSEHGMVREERDRAI